jgi:hypothetical protein
MDVLFPGHGPIIAASRTDAGVHAFQNVSTSESLSASPTTPPPSLTGARRRWMITPCGCLGGAGGARNHPAGHTWLPTCVSQCWWVPALRVGPQSDHLHWHHWHSAQPRVHARLFVDPFDAACCLKPRRMQTHPPPTTQLTHAGPVALGEAAPGCRPLRCERPSTALCCLRTPGAPWLSRTWTCSPPSAGSTPSAAPWERRTFTGVCACACVRVCRSGRRSVCSGKAGHGTGCQSTPVSPSCPAPPLPPPGHPQP